MGIQRFLVAGLWLAAAVSRGAAAAETIRIADIDGPTGEVWMRAEDTSSSTRCIWPRSAAPARAA